MSTGIRGRPRKTVNDPVLILLGQRIRRARLARGWAQHELADKAGIKPDTLSTYENGTREPGVVYALRVAAALEITLDELLADPVCPRCDGFPPAGFSCPACSRESAP